ncbi:hypothetical protein GVX82_04840 [Patescibacteria group bacterium]|jgi:dCTP deaminase|nr:hypothetical protein [Patescibacteria group bacterium]
MVRRYGALPSQKLRELISGGFIFGADEAHISPASLDLTLTDEIYEVEGAMQPAQGETVRELLASVEHRARSLDEPLWPHVTYLARLSESLALPESVYGFCNPKSSTGRIDLHVRILADGIQRFDTVAPAGYRGELWLLITPRSFPVRVRHGETLTQLRLFNGDTRFSELDLEVAFREYKLLWSGERNEPITYRDVPVSDADGSIILTAGFSGEVVGYECITEERVLDTGAIKGYDAAEFFAPLTTDAGRLHLKKDRFYILTTRERVRIPPTLASEMVPMDERAGDFRSHYAGFIDPGWGWGAIGEGFGRPYTLEVRPFEDLYIREGQPIAKIRFEHLLEEPDIQYDTRASNYLSQDGPKLGKQFR